MLNIISRSILFKNVSGPKKVVENLIKGLDKLGYPYVINKRLDVCKRLWIHDDTVALKKIASLPPEIKVIVGPNLHNLPRSIPHNIDISRAIYLLPSEWWKNFFMYFGFKNAILDIWPVGIDTEEFKFFDKKNEFVLIYFKERLLDELYFAEKLLKQKRIPFKIIKYGTYKEEFYKNLLSRSRYIIWIGRHETQGIALEEALSCNIPILVWDIVSFRQLGYQMEVKIFNDKEIDYNKFITAAPYFDDSCGIKIKDASELEKAIDFMEKNLDKFQPRKYILENLSLEKQAKEFILLYQKHFGLSYEDGFKEKLLRSGDWLNNKLYYIIYLKLRSCIKKFLIKLKG